MVQEPTNAQIAELLERIADLLEAQEANPFRVRAYREAAQTIRNIDQSVSQLIREGQADDVRALPHIGEGIAAVIDDYVTSGKSGLLTDLEAQVSPEMVVAQVPGIGPTLARRIVDELHIRTLAELEEAAHDGRLASVEGFGSRRVEGVRTALSGMLSRSARAQHRSRTARTQKQAPKCDDRPSVELLLKVDADYRKQAKAGKLQKIAPRRYNPRGEAWLPVLHTKRQGWSFTALFSNTAQAHELGKTQDWVVIYYERDGEERQNTVVTETQGPLKGKRVVRGRDPENQQYYQQVA
jgi:Helix-hairpin-helix domain